MNPSSVRAIPPDAPIPTPSANMGSAEFGSVVATPFAGLLEKLFAATTKTDGVREGPDQPDPSTDSPREKMAPDRHNAVNDASPDKEYSPTRELTEAPSGHDQEPAQENRQDLQDSTQPDRSRPTSEVHSDSSDSARSDSKTDARSEPSTESPSSEPIGDDEVLPIAPPTSSVGTTVSTPIVIVQPNVASISTNSTTLGAGMETSLSGNGGASNSGSSTPAGVTTPVQTGTANPAAPVVLAPATGLTSVMEATPLLTEASAETAGTVSSETGSRGSGQVFGETVPSSVLLPPEEGALLQPTGTRSVPIVLPTPAEGNVQNALESSTLRGSGEIRSGLDGMGARGGGLDQPGTGVQEGQRLDSIRSANGNEVPQRVANQQEIFDRIVKMARFARAGDRSSARLWLQPPSLGSVRIHLTVEKGVVEAQILTETPAARSSLSSGLAELREALEKQGLEIGGFQVSVDGGEGERSTGENSETASSSDSNPDLSDPTQSGDEATDGPSLRSGLGLIDLTI